MSSFQLAYRLQERWKKDGGAENRRGGAPLPFLGLVLAWVAPSDWLFGYDMILSSALLQPPNHFTTHL